MSYILSIDTSTEICSVALSKGTEQVAFRENLEGRSHAKILLPLIEETLQEAHIQPTQLQAVAVSMGPGSYTGLRIGVSTAKGLCFSLGIPFIAIPTLQLIAAGAAQTARPTNVRFCAMLDARRMEVFTAIFDQQLNTLSECQSLIIDENSFTEELKAGVIVFCGNGATKCQELLSKYPNAQFDFSRISASNMRLLALQKFENQQFEDVAYCEPMYGKEYVAAKPNVKGLH